MTTPSEQQLLLELPEPSQILYDELLRTHKAVMGLYPLIDLLKRPDDEKESLGERLALLLTELTQTLSNFQSQQAAMTKALELSIEAAETAAKTSLERQIGLEKKIDLILGVLNLPLK